MIVGTLKPITYTLPSVGFAAVLPQFDPPWLPGHVDHFVEADRRERSVVSGLQDALPELLALLGRQDVRVQIVGGELLARERRRARRERLRGPQRFARHLGLLRHGTFLDRPDRLAGDAIEHVEIAGLAGHGDDIDGPAVPPDGRQLRGRVVVEIPDVVVDRLEMPEPLAGPDVERDEAVAEEVGALAGCRRRSCTWGSRSGRR